MTISPVSAILKAALSESGLSQRRLALRIGCSPQHLSRLVAGSKTVSVRCAVRLQGVIGVDAWQLLSQQLRWRLDREDATSWPPKPGRG